MLGVVMLKVFMLSVVVPTQIGPSFDHKDCPLAEMSVGVKHYSLLHHFVYYVQKSFIIMTTFFRPRRSFALGRNSRQIGTR